MLGLEDHFDDDGGGANDASIVVHELGEVVQVVDLPRRQLQQQHVYQ